MRALTLSFICSTSLLFARSSLGDAAKAEEIKTITYKESCNSSPAPKKAPKKGVAKKRKKHLHRCSGHASQSYRRMVRNWQKPPAVPRPQYRDGFRDLLLNSVNLGERIRVFPYLADGSLDLAVMEQVDHLLRDKNSDAEHPIHPRLVKLLYLLAEKFDARQVNIISGYRESPDAVTESKHKKGQAVDFMIPGVPLAALAREARKLGHVGVGFYPSSGFVHLDVRGEGPSYFWTDRSGPGLGPCTQRAFAGQGPKMDRKWSQDKDEPAPRRDKKGELLGATKTQIVNTSHGG